MKDLMALPARLLLILPALLLFIHPAKAFGAESYRTEYTSVQYDSIDNFETFEQAMSQAFHRTRGPESDYLSRKIDRIVEDVESFLDMYPRKFQVNIVLLANHQELQEKYNLGGGDKLIFAYFRQSTKTIYLSLDNINPKILTHEMAHAVISAFFNGAAPPKTQELLAIAAGEQLEE